jgi:hypothetical protein
LAAAFTASPACRNAVPSAFSLSASAMQKATRSGPDINGVGRATTFAAVLLSIAAADDDDITQRDQMTTAGTAAAVSRSGRVAKVKDDQLPNAS